MGSTHVNRRDLIKQAAVAGLIAVPAVGALTSCASGSGDDKKVAKGEKSAENPLGVNKSAALEVYIFDGGFGTKYAKDAQAVYEKKFPKAKTDLKSTQKIQSVLQPRFNGGTPPDLIDNSGAEQMDMGVLVGKKQLTDLTKLLDAPSIDDPDKKVRDTLRPGVVEMGQFDGDPVWIMYYAYTVYGVWYSQKALDKLDAEYPETWDDMLKVCAKAKKKGMAGWTYAGKHPYY
ncbi:MAG: extracellular solute-binding protein, partial [Streptomyces sp.]|uniref:extracellular solute-binding protein n=1 Tax=Streptomyces sp. TaxID=1931 RepID=UPI003D6C3230